MYYRFLALGVLGLLASASVAQEPPDSPGQSNDFPPQQAYELRGSEVPYYYSVRAFLQHGYDALGRGTAAWGRLLDGVGVQPGSASEEELRTAILLAANVWSRAPQIEANPAEDPERFDEEQMRWRREQRQGLAPICRQLREVITEEYGSATNLDAFIAERITPGLSLGSTEPFGEEELMLNADFDALALKEDDR